MEDNQNKTNFPPSNLPVLKKPEPVLGPLSGPKVIPPPPPSISKPPEVKAPPSQVGSKSEVTKPLPSESLSSSFRTMTSDLEATKKGQAPSSSVLQIKPEAPKISTQEKPLEPAKPLTPSPPPIQVKLGEAEKARPLPALTPSPKVPPPPIKPEAIIIPPKKSSGKLIPLIIVLVLLLLGAGGYWYFVREPEIVYSPTPEPTLEPTQTPKPSLFESLGAVANIFPEGSINLNFSSLSAGKADFPPLSFEKPLFIKALNSLGSDMSLSVFLEGLGISGPLGFNDSLNQDNWLIFFHGQKETFSSKGVRSERLSPLPMVGLVAQVQSDVSLRSALNVWESTLGKDLSGFLGYPLSKAKTAEFLDNHYKEIGIRYVNFPYPDTSLDYAIVTVSDGPNYLVISGSRESIYSIIDVLNSL